MKNKSYLYFLIFILFICSCSKTNIKSIENVKLQKKFEISAYCKDSLESIALHSCDTRGNIYIYDNINKKVIVFDSLGKYSYQFGKEGKGPGEFQKIVSIIPNKHNIIINDYKKSSIIKYDFNGKFISEKKVPKIVIRQTISKGGNFLSWYKIFSAQENEMIMKKGIGIFTDSLVLKKDICSVKSKYNPYIFDPNYFISAFSLNKKNGDIAISEIDNKGFNIDIFNKNYKLINNLYLDFPKIKYKEKTLNEIQNFYHRYEKKMVEKYGNKFKVKKFNSYTRLVKDVAYDSDSNLWILTPQIKNPDKVKIILYDNKYNLKGFFNTDLPLGKMSIIENNLIYLSGKNYENSKIVVYEIKKN